MIKWMPGARERGACFIAARGSSDQYSISRTLAEESVHGWSSERPATAELT